MAAPPDALRARRGPRRCAPGPATVVPLALAAAAALVAALAPAAARATTAAGGAPDPAAVCDRHITEVEHEAGLPSGLLRAIALAESGRWLPDRRESRPWPWTVTSGVEERYHLPSRAAALAKVAELRARGRRNIDVGCMQVNLYYHGDAFPGPDAALDPARNVAYAADFLRRLRDETRSWGVAVARYHSNDATRGRDYRERVYRLWRDERVRLAGLRRAKRPAGIGYAAAAAAADGAAGPWRWLRGADAAVEGIPSDEAEVRRGTPRAAPGNVAPARLRP